MTTIESIQLYGGSTERQSSSMPTHLALLFGAMVKRATPIVQHYQSDLFHDAQWLAINATKPLTFEWLVHEFGTHIGDVARTSVRIGVGDTAEFYQITLGLERDVWCATFRNIPIDLVAVLLPLHNH